MAQENKPKITVHYKEIAKGMMQAEYECPPHVWYYANMIMHWKCEFCPAMRHKEPKTGLRSKDIERINPDGTRSVSF